MAKPAPVLLTTPSPVPVVETLTTVPFPKVLALITLLAFALFEIEILAAIPLVLVAFKPVPVLLFA
ncbi:hypothetical protein D3C78_1740130 [compost metagenome]